MKKLIILLVILICSNILSAQWVAGPALNSSVLSLNSNTNYLIAGTISKIYFSNDNGNNWIEKNNGLNINTVTSIVTDNNMIFLGTGDGVYLSTNNGDNWTLKINGFLYHNVQALVKNGAVLYAGTSAGVYSSSNNGDSWTQITNGLPYNLSVSSFAFKDNYIFVSAWGDGVFRSTDNGNTWTQQNNGITELGITSLISLGTNIIAGSWGNYIYLSTNYGLDWVNINSGLPAKYIQCLYLKENKIIAGTNLGIFASMDGGFNWISKNQGLPIVTFFYGFTFKDGYMFAACNNKQVWRIGYTELIGIQNINNTIPLEYKLYQNYPNPFNPETSIKFEIINSDSPVRLSIFDITGKEVSILINQAMKPGTYEYKYNAEKLNSGIYFYVLKAGSYIETRKMMLIK